MRQGISSPFSFQFLTVKVPDTVVAIATRYCGCVPVRRLANIVRTPFSQAKDTRYLRAFESAAHARLAEALDPSLVTQVIHEQPGRHPNPVGTNVEQ